MTNGEQQEFKKLIKDGTVEALRSEDGQKAIISAIHSQEGQEAIQRGAVSALKSENGKDAMLDVFVEAFHEVVVPAFEDRDEKIKNLESKVERLGELRGIS